MGSAKESTRKQKIHTYMFFKSKQQEECIKVWVGVKNSIKFVHPLHIFSMLFAKNIGEVGMLWFHSHLCISGGVDEAISSPAKWK